ncbi:MAG: tyrosine-protein phosphatase [Rhodospirillaceae bacterium]|nr:tyrosine-protein phosphatase [Rhodospirillaceae bacterium]
MRAIHFALVSVAVAVAVDHATAAVNEAGVTRTGDRLEVRWTATGPVDVSLAARPDAPAAERRLVSDDDADGVHVLPAGEGRAFVHLATADGAGLWVAERVVPLQGAKNFRDLGGYRTADGKRVKWGKIYRADQLSRLTDADYAVIDDLGISVVCDLRLPDERRRDATAWRAGDPDMIWFDPTDGVTDPMQAFADVERTADGMRAALIASYGEMAERQAPHYQAMFERLAAGERGLLFHCTAGKDRTGLGAALLLTALGVPYDTVRQDYQLTEVLVDPAKQAAMYAQAAAQGGGGQGSAAAANMLAGIPAEGLAVLLRADPAYLDAAFAAIKADYGSIEGYLDRRLGIDAAEIAQMKSHLLE